MDGRFTRFFHLLGEPLEGRSRVGLALLVVPLALAFSGPLWTMQMDAPQYPAGLHLAIYAYTVDGDVDEVNKLNHYIGMETIDRASLSDLDWIPFAIGGLVLLTLRAAAIGSLRILIDLVVLFLYFSVFSMARFAYKLYTVGHNLDPRAPFDVEPFTPVILGTQEIANFSVTSLPGAGSVWIGLFGAGLLLALAWNLVVLPRRRVPGVG